MITVTVLTVHAIFMTTVRLLCHLARYLCLSTPLQCVSDSNAHSLIRKVSLPMGQCRQYRQVPLEDTCVSLSDHALLLLNSVCDMAFTFDMVHLFLLVVKVLQDA